MDNTELLESVLMLAPTTLELGLTPLKLLHFDSPELLQQEIADLVDARAANDRYAPIQIMSSEELKFFVDTFAKNANAHNGVSRLRALLYAEDAQTIYLWNGKRRHCLLKLG